MGHCLHHLLLIYHLLRYYGNNLLNRGPVKLYPGLEVPNINFILFDKIDMTYKISVSELTPPPNFSLIPPKNKKSAKSWNLIRKTRSDLITGDQW